MQRVIDSLDNLMEGAVKERFNVELQELWKNIFDMRTSPTKARTITLTFSFIPSVNRDAAAMRYDVKTKLSPPEPLTQTVLMRQKDDGTVIVSEKSDQVAGQMDMQGRESPLPNVIEFKPTSGIQ